MPHSQALIGISPYLGQFDDELFQTAFELPLGWQLHPSYLEASCTRTGHIARCDFNSVAMRNEGTGYPVAVHNQFADTSATQSSTEFAYTLMSE